MFSTSVRSVTITVALQLPPIESCRSRVSFESRHGTCAFEPVPESFSMHEPSAYSDWLMFFASSCRSFFGLIGADFLDDSIPARSTRLSFACRSGPDAIISFR